MQSKYCPSAAGPRIKQQLVTYWSKKNYVSPQIQNWIYTLLLLRSRINTGFLGAIATTVTELCALCEARAEVEETVEHLRSHRKKSVQLRAYDTTQHNQMETIPWKRLKKQFS